MMRFNFLAFFIALFISIFPVPSESFGNEASTNNPHITEVQWKQLTDKQAFDYKTEIEVSQPRKSNPAGTYISHLLNAIIVFFTTTLGKTILWILVFLIVSLALLKVLTKEKNLFGKRSKKEVAATSTDEILTEDLLQTNWEERLEIAMKEKNLRLAIRLSFLLLLQLLQEKDQIQYRPDKTNHDYYAEIDNALVRKNFRMILRQYEFVWYGNYPIGDEQFEAYIKTFYQFKDQLYHS